MGFFSNSDKEKPTITFEHRKGAYFPGDIVEGVMTIEFPSDQWIKKMNLHFEGLEKVKFGYQDSSNRHNTISDKRSYKYPFSFGLDHDIPNTFSHDRYDFKGIVSYNLKVEIDRSGLSDFETTEEIFVHPKPLKDTKPVFGAKDANVSTCCFSKGMTSVTANFAKDAFMAGDTIFGNIEVDNTCCTKRIRNVKFILRYEIELSGSNSILGLSLNKKKKSYLIDYTGSFGPLEAGSKVSHAVKESVEYNVLLQPQYNAKFIKVDMSIIVRLDFSCSQDVNLRFPVSLYYPPNITSLLEYANLGGTWYILDTVIEPQDDKSSSSGKK